MKKDDRIYIRIPKVLKERAQEYARRNHTELSTVIAHLLVKVLEEDERNRNPMDADQV